MRPRRKARVRRAGMGAAPGHRGRGWARCTPCGPAASAARLGHSSRRAAAWRSSFCFHCQCWGCRFGCFAASARGSDPPVSHASLRAAYRRISRPRTRAFGSAAVAAGCHGAYGAAACAAGGDAPGVWRNIGWMGAGERDGGPAAAAPSADTAVSQAHRPRHAALTVLGSSSATVVVFAAAAAR
jgi:hypothetical protein